MQYDKSKQTLLGKQLSELLQGTNSSRFIVTFLKTVLIREKENSGA